MILGIAHSFMRVYRPLDVATRQRASGGSPEMAKTFHDAREARKSSRVTRAQLLSAAETLAETLETIAERREAQHSAEMAARQCTDTDGIGNDLVWVGDWE